MKFVVTVDFDESVSKASMEIKLLEEKEQRPATFAEKLAALSLARYALHEYESGVINGMKE